MWWVREILQKNKAHRPKLIEIRTSRNIEWSGIYVTNSPSFNIVPDDVENVYMHDFEIYTNLWGILDIFKLFGSQLDSELVNVGGINIELPIFPLNTDAIDFTGRNGTFRNIKITNFDDVVVPKPARKGNKYGDCTTDVLVEDCEVYFSTGMAIGSVPPHRNHNCINGVIYRNITFHYPFKAIYVKTNPVHESNHGNESGEIANIVYENIKINYPIWWGVYIGPQQQHQPGGAGPGCMFYPINKNCETDPLVPIDNITLTNVTSHGSILPAGIIRCNSTRPCTGFKFNNVQLKSPLWDVAKLGFITEYAEGTSVNSFPDPNLKPPGYY